MDSEEFDEKMAEEVGKWDELGVNIGAYRPSEGMLGLIFRFEALNNVLRKNGLLDEDEVNEEFREVSLSGLKMVRETVIEPAIEQARQEAIRAQIVGPNGMPPTMRVPKKRP